MKKTASITSISQPRTRDLKIAMQSIAKSAGERAAQTDQDRVVSAEVVSAMRDAGLFRALQPAHWGGAEIDNAEWLDLIVELARECGSSAWVYSVLSAHATAIACFPVEAQTEIWTENPWAVASSAVAPTAIARRVDGGFAISGKWSFSSGCDYAQWALAGARVENGEGEAPGMIFTLIPFKDIRIEDDWHVVGLRGTGSKSIHVADVFVPEYRTLPFRQLMDGNAIGALDYETPYYRSPRHAWAPSGLAAVGVGIALGFVGKFTAYARDRKILNGATMGDLDTIQLKISESAAEAEAALRILKANTAEAMAEVAATGTLTIGTRARCRRDQAFATRLCMVAVDRLYTAAGAYAIYEGNSMQQAFRDMHAVAGQVVLNFDAAGKSFSRVMMGRVPDDMLL